EVQSKEGKPIEVGDIVSTRFRGGKREGEVNIIPRDIQNVDDVGVTVKNPPKVVFTDQHGHRVVHNPETLSHGQD
ncbi:hypothetical protein WOLCODRAFT_72867, partial [Wolfiporia cocos MD-104 SS10]